MPLLMSFFDRRLARIMISATTHLFLDSIRKILREADITRAPETLFPVTSPITRAVLARPYFGKIVKISANLPGRMENAAKSYPFDCRTFTGQHAHLKIAGNIELFFHALLFEILLEQTGIFNGHRSLVRQNIQYIDILPAIKFSRFFTA